MRTKPYQESEEEDDTEEVEEADDEELSSASEELDYEDDVAEESDEGSDEGSSESSEEASESEQEPAITQVQESLLNRDQDKSSKKRKRSAKEEEVEDVYMRKLAREEVKEEEERKKKQKTEADKSKQEAADLSDDSDNKSYTIPKHETQLESNDTQEQELEKAARTVFLGNVSSEAITSKSAKKSLLRHLASFIDDLADNTPPHKVESLRFRSTAFTSTLPKRAAFAKKEVLNATTKSTNAYAVYSTPTAAREAAKRLNGTVVLNRHLRVDWLAHPAKTDHRRCVFVGNLGFVDDESTLKTDDDDKKKKTKPPGDVEEGLWVHFGKAGKVESVRVVRDSKTRVGKGIAYVQFEHENGVEAALQFNEQKFPPLLPRKLRVVRAKALKRKEKRPAALANDSKSKGVYNAKVTEEQKTTQGRARAMLGKAGAFKTAESFVFEGHRASSKQGNSGLKLGGKKKGRPSNRSTKRAAAWKSAGGKAQFKK